MKSQSESFVEVNDEPKHKELFRNPYIRLYSVVFRPGDQTLYHRHTVNTVYTVVQGGVIKTQNAQGFTGYPMRFPKSAGFFTKTAFAVRSRFTTALTMPDGFCFYLPHKEQPIVHKATISAQNKKDMVMLGVEFLNAPHPDNAVHPGSVYKLEFDTDQFSAFRIKLKPGQKTGSQAGPFPCVIIPLQEAKLQANREESTLKPGGFRWLDAGSGYSISNTGSKRFEALVIALK